MVQTLVQRFSNRTDYTFSNFPLLEEALTHPSFIQCRDDIGRIKNSERLEYLGDSVLNMVVSDLLFTMFPDEKAGHLTIRRKHLVDGKTLYEVAKSINLCDFIIKDKNNGGKCNSKSLENAVEAVVGAIYIDGGFEKAREFVLKYWGTLAREREDYKDPKTALQEWSLTNKQPLPSYRTISESGPQHKPRFTVRANVYYLGTATATASTKKEAQLKAAEMLLEKLTNSSNKTHGGSSDGVDFRKEDNNNTITDKITNTE